LLLLDDVSRTDTVKNWGEDSDVDVEVSQTRKPDDVIRKPTGRDVFAAMKELGYSEDEIMMMKESVRSTVIDMKLRRPRKGIPAEWIGVKDNMKKSKNVKSKNNGEFRPQSFGGADDPKNESMRGRARRRVLQHENGNDNYDDKKPGRSPRASKNEFSWKNSDSFDDDITPKQVLVSYR
jgi:hypothetical protein